MLKLLNLKRTEASRLVHAAAVFFLIQVNDSLVKSVASAVFNIRAGVDRLPMMYLWVAGLFSLSMVLLSLLSGKVRRQRLLFGLYSGLLAILLFNSLMLWGVRSGSGVELATEFYSFLFISSELVRSLAGFQIWIVAGGICYASRAKVLFPLWAASATVGDIFGGFLTRLLGPLLDSYLLYGLAVLNMGLVIVLLKPLMKRYFVGLQEGDQAEGASFAEILRFFSRSSYLKLLMVLSVGSFGLYTALHYSFNVVTRSHFPSEAEITGVFGLFYGLTGIVTLVVTTVVLRWLLRWLGAGYIYMWACLVYGAITLVLLTVFAEVLPVSHVAIIFAFNLLNFVLLDSIVAPTYQVLIKMIPERYSDGTRMLMEGGFMFLGGLLGAGLTILHAKHFWALDQMFLVLTGLAVVMVAVGWRLRQAYTGVLIRAVRERDIDVEDDQAMASLGKLVAASGDFSSNLLQHRDDGVRQLGIEVLRRNPGPAATAACLPLVRHQNPRIRSAALTALGADVASEEVLERILPLLDDGDMEVRLEAARVLGRLLEAGGQADWRLETTHRVQEAIRERLIPDAGYGPLEGEFLVILEKLDDEESALLRQVALQNLLDSDIVEERIAGIETVRRLGLGMLHPQLSEGVYDAHPVVREVTIRCLGEMAPEVGFEPCMELLDDPDPDVVQVAVECLGCVGEAEYRCRMVEALNGRSLRRWEGLMAALLLSEDQTEIEALTASCLARLVEANRYEIAIHWLMELTSDPAVDLLIDQLKLEQETVERGVVRLLGSMSDTAVVNDLVERLGEKTGQGREHAIDLLENIGDQALLAMLLPLLEMDPSERLDGALQISDWQPKGADEILAYLLRVADPWTQMAAAWVCGLIDKAVLLTDLPGDLEMPVREVIDQIEGQKERDGMDTHGLPLTTMEKIAFLKESSFFAALPLEELYQIALSVQEESVRQGDVVIREGTLGDKMYIVVSGRLEVNKADGETAEYQIAELGEKQVFGEMALLDDEPRSASVKVLEDAHLLSLQRSDLERILRRYSSIAFGMMRILSRRLRDSMAA
jgi:HEAT repeat protein